MPENKKQHYVPQFYLKSFSKDRANICNYHLGSRKLNRMSIEDICQGSYFYDNDTELEKALSGLEQLQANVIRKMIDNQSLDCILNSTRQEDYFHLLMFLLLQHSRTKQTKVTMDKTIDDLFNECIIPELNKNQDKNIGSVKISVGRSHIFSMGPAMMGVELISDLLPLLIVNNTESHFITSDAPVVLYNHLKIQECSLLGYQSPGLQIYCPLNEKLLLLLIHADFYKINHNSKLIITLKNAADVDELNKLQFFNCLNSVILSDDIELSYLVNLHKSVEDKISTNKIKPEYVSRSTQKEENNRKIIKISKLSIDYNLKLSFLKLNHEGDRVVKPWIKEIIKRNPTVVFVRDKVICDIVNKRIDEKMKEVKLKTQ